MFDFYQVLLVALMGAYDTPPPPPASVNMAAPSVQCRSYDAGAARHAYEESWIRYAAGDVDGAARWLKTYLTECPHDAAAQHRLGRMYEQFGDGDKAARRYRCALNFAPDDLEARTDLARVYLKTRNFRAARRQLDLLQAQCHGDCQTLEELRAAIDGAQSS